MESLDKSHILVSDSWEAVLTLTADEFDLLARGWPSIFKIPRKQHRIT